MKRKILFIFLSCYLSFNSIKAQTLDWAKSLPYASYVTKTNNVIEDSDGNIYISGVGMSSLFIIKYAPDGSLMWGKNYGGYNSVNSMCVDSSGNLYVVIMIGQINIDGTGYTENNGGGYLFIKYDINGNIIWLKQMKPSLHLSEKLDSHGNLVASGGFVDTVHFDNGIILLAPPPGRVSFFMGKFNDNGECIWAIQDDGSHFSAPIINKNDELFFNDFFNTTTITLGKGIKQVTFNSSNGDSYCAKYNSTGDLIWAKLLTTGLIAPDEFGNAYTLEYDSNYPNTAFITKYDTIGNLIWKRTSIYTNDVYKLQMQCGANNDVYISGGFKNSLTIDSTIIAGGPDYKMFLAKLDSSGTLKWITTSSGSGGAGAKDIFVSGNEIFITGDMGGQNTFGSYSLNEPNGGVFTLKITDDEMLSTKVNENVSTTNGLTVFPNPSNQIITVSFSKPDCRQLQLSIKNQLGQVVYSFNGNDVQGKFVKDINLGKQAKGVYFIEVVADEERLVKKVVLE